MQISVNLFLFSTWLCVFIANFFGNLSLKLRARLRFLGYVDKMSGSKKIKNRERSPGISQTG